MQAFINFAQMNVTYTGQYFLIFDFQQIKTDEIA